MDQEVDKMNCSHRLKKRLRCIVKLGGAAITWKDELEMINEKNLASVTLQLRQAMLSHSTVIETMDWSKRDGTAELVVPDSFGDQKISLDPFILVHGAGSFGHFQASKSGVHKGGLPSHFVTAGFVATRISVTSLNLAVVRALAQDGIPALGISPLASGWSTCNRNVENANISEVARIIDSGFIPVLHGDAVFDSGQGCTILSGDVIIRQLAQELMPQYVVFLTDVPGVFDRPPTEANAVLLNEIVVNEDGSWSIVKPALPHMNKAGFRSGPHFWLCRFPVRSSSDNIDMYQNIYHTKMLGFRKILKFCFPLPLPAPSSLGSTASSHYVSSSANGHRST